MAQATPKKALKVAVKEAFAEALLEQRDLLRELMAEALEDIVLAEAIREGRRSKPAAREDVFRILKSSE